MSDISNNENNEFWVFGYGSLVWKADFPFVEKKIGYIKGFVRRFYQHSIDHRGTVENPGRVVTLLPSEDRNAKVLGVAYRIDEANKQQVVDHLDYREINGYQRVPVKFFPNSYKDDTTQSPENPIDLIVYVATEDNASFAGEMDINSMVEQIYRSEGKSGKNRDYVYQLADAMRTLYPGENDEHLFLIECKLKELEDKLKV